MDGSVSGRRESRIGWTMCPCVAPGDTVPERSVKSSATRCEPRAQRVRGSTIRSVGVFAKRPFRRGEASSRSTVGSSTPKHPLDSSRDESRVHCDWFPDHVILRGEPERYLNPSLRAEQLRRDGRQRSSVARGVSRHRRGRRDHA
jgi:hypothetical protein